MLRVNGPATTINAQTAFVVTVYGISQALTSEARSFGFTLGPNSAEQTHSFTVTDQIPTTSAYNFISVTNIATTGTQATTGTLTFDIEFEEVEGASITSFRVMFGESYYEIVSGASMAFTSSGTAIATDTQEANGRTITATFSEPPMEIANSYTVTISGFSWPFGDAKVGFSSSFTVFAGTADALTFASVEGVDAELDRIPPIILNEQLNLLSGCRREGEEFDEEGNKRSGKEFKFFSAIPTNICICASKGFHRPG